MTTTEGDTVSVRRATLSDFRSVMDISEGIYFGWDYLPYYYYVYLQDKRSNCFVVTSQDRVIGFLNLYFIEDDCAVKVAFRISEEYRGKGIGKILESESLKKTLEKYPNVRVLRWTTFYQSTIQRAASSHPDRSVPFRWTVVTIEMNCRDIPVVAVETEIASSIREIRRLTLTESYKIFSNAELVKDLFPGKYFSVDYGSWLPILTSETNLRHVAMHRDVTASFTPDGVTSITFCTIYRLVPAGFRVLVWCYGNKLTPKMVIAHVQFCLGNMTSFPPFCDVNVSVGILFPTHVDKQDVENYFSNKGVSPVPEQSTQCAIIEHVLKH